MVDGIRAQDLTGDEGLMLASYEAAKERLDDRRLFLEGPEGEHLIVRASSGSRHFKKGRSRLSRKLEQRFGVTGRRSGVLVTLTCDPKMRSREATWDGFGKRLSGFLNAVKERRRRRGWHREWWYMWVVEEHKSTGLPHVHVFFPGLRWLESQALLEELWGWGIVDVRGKKTVRVAGYLIKYLRKMSGWSRLGLAYLWWFRRRMWTTSRALPAGSGEGERGWHLIGQFVSGEGAGLFDGLVRLATVEEVVQFVRAEWGVVRGLEEAFG